MGEGRRGAGTIRKLRKNGDLGVEAKRFYWGGGCLVVSPALYGAETWGQRGGSWVFLRWGV